jgi:VWFA-related protein
VVRITTSLVQVDAVVTKNDKQVTNLKAEDFEILEDGHARLITSFAYISNVVSTQSAVAATPKDKSAPPVVTPPRPYDVRRTIALVVDDLGLSFESIFRVKRQLHKFVDEQLQTNDLAAIIRTGGDVGALQQFTTDRRLLHSAVDHLKWNPCSRGGVLTQPPVQAGIEPARAPGARGLGQDAGDPANNLCSGRTVGSTLRSLRFILQGMREVSGRKSMVLFSDYLPVEEQEPGHATSEAPAGSPQIFDNAIRYELAINKIAELAIRASVVIYAVDTRSLQTTGLTAADRISFPPIQSKRPGSVPTAGAAINAQRVPGIIQDRSRALWVGREGSDFIAKQTGGFLVRNANDFELPRVMEDQQGYYLIGYRPTEETFDRRFHQITVRTKQRGLTVRSRAGFYGVTDKDMRAPAPTVKDQTAMALVSPFAAIDIPVRLTPLFANATTGSFIHSWLYLDARDLTFADEADGWHKTTFDLSTIIFGDNGAVVSQTAQTESLRIHGRSYERVLRDGLVYSFDTPIKDSGSYQFRVAVRDAASSRIGTAGQFVEVPDLRSGQLALSGISVSGRLDAPTSENANATGSEEQKGVDLDARARPGIRVFRQTPNLFYGYTIYNAQVDKTTRAPKLSALTRVFRDGKPIFTGQPLPVDLVDQSDLQRINAGGVLQLGGGLPPGEYLLQIVITDLTGKDNQHRTATQWIDFEIVR